ncbi:MAG: hypothetical protein WD768_22830 [Phycisphaeraceae bacterium]
MHASPMARLGEPSGYRKFVRRSTPTARGLAIGLGVVFTLIASTPAQADDLLDALKQLDANVLPTDDGSRKEHQRMLPDLASRLLREANRDSTKAWREIQSREDWERFRSAKVASLTKAIGGQVDHHEAPAIHIARTLDGEGFRIQCIAFASRPQFYITANLYVPDPIPSSAPGIVIHPSHHNPKTQGELQDMGMTWARAGCYVLVMDQVGHGERRAHPFITDQDYAKPFRASRQDYYFRYNTGMQLHLVGDSLTGWQVHDLRTGVDVLLAQKNIDPKRIIMMGSVAGGGDPVACAAAIDQRITAAVVFNFGGPQPESRYPLPEDAAETFGYAGSGSWESTRNLSYSARDGFLPWAIVGSIAPRRLVYAHEFVWDREHDPVWTRLQTIYGWVDAKDQLAFAHGYGLLRESGDKASHCNNIGPPHRKHIHPALEKWFNIRVEKEYSNRKSSSDLLVMSPELKEKLKPLSLYEAAMQRAEPRGDRPRVSDMQPDQAREAVREAWSLRLGDIAPPDRRTMKPLSQVSKTELNGATAHRFTIEVEEGIEVPVLLLVPPPKGDAKPAVVVMVSQQGKSALLAARAEAIAACLREGVAVCLPDVRGTGETRIDRDRGRGSWDTGVSSSFLMLGKPVLGQRLKDLRAVLDQLRLRDDVDARKLALWGDSLASVNDPERDLRIPHAADDVPANAEPLGGMLALLAGLYEDDVKAIYVRGGLATLRTALESEFVYLPHDSIVPGAIACGDVPDLLRAQGRRLLWLEGLVTAQNQPLGKAQAEVFKDFLDSANDKISLKSMVLMAEKPSDPAMVGKRLSGLIKK